MALLGNSVQKKEIDIQSDSLDWYEIIRLAYEQSVGNLLAYALNANAAIACPEEFRADMISRMRVATVKNVICRKYIMKLLQDFEAEGIPVVLLKGYAVAEEYCAPECRTSSDTDIWVTPENEERACAFLEKQGFEVQPRWKNGHHAVCHHPVMGTVELHVILYDEIIEEIWFNRTDGHEFVAEPRERVDEKEASYYTLGKTDHLIFLTLHMVKHFIISGMSLRMMLDVSLFLKNHSHEMDIDRFWNTLMSLKYDNCVNAVLTAMVRYAGFSAEDFPGFVIADDVRVAEMLNDLELGGSMGMNDRQSREDGSNAYNREKMLKNRSKFGYILYMIKWQSSLYLKAIFPTREVLAERYPYVLTKPLLIPFAWVHRMVTRGIIRLKKGNLINHAVINEDKISSSGKERLEMFRRLGML